MVEKERKEEEKAKDMATASTKEKEEEATKEERKAEVEEKEEVTKEDSKAKAEDLEVERPMLVCVIIAIGLVTMKLIADKSKETCKVATSGKHSKMISKVLHPPVLLLHCLHQSLPELQTFPLSSCLTSQIPQLTIRQVSMHHIGEQPEILPEQFDLDEDEEKAEINYFGRILRVEEYSLSDNKEHPISSITMVQWRA